MFALALFLVLVFGVVFVLKNNTETSETKNKTSHIAIITDIDHCQSRKIIPKSTLKQFVNFAQKERADAIVSLGDNISHRLRNCSDFAGEDLPYVLDALRASEIPAHFVLGDHDIASSVDSWQFWLAQTGRDTTYYAFDTENARNIIIDTILGGEAMSPSCEENPTCAEALENYKQLKKDRANLPENSAKYQKLKKEGKKYKSAVDNYREKTKNTRSSGRRDKGRVGKAQLDWLKRELSETDKDTIVLFSDHPLIPHTRQSGKKSYNIVNGDKLRKILEKAVRNGKRVVSVSGETHEWFTRELNGVKYYGIAELARDDGSWAMLEITSENINLNRFPLHQNR